jgi:hypothetical protein
MAKKQDSKSRVVTRDAKTGAIISKKKGPGGGELWSVRSADGSFAEVVTTDPRSAASMDRAVKRYSRALKRLAKR